MNALSSFCSDTPVYCAITIDLKPVAFRPFAQIPQIPQVDRMEQLKTYGDADSTESTSARVCALELNGGVEVSVRMSPEVIPVPIEFTVWGTR